VIKIQVIHKKCLGTRTGVDLARDPIQGRDHNQDLVIDLGLDLAHHTEDLIPIAKEKEKTNWIEETRSEGPQNGLVY